MATFLVRLRVRAGSEGEFEATVAALHDATHEREPGVLRYEYWRGAGERTYYAMASFVDFDAFLDHQTSEHHERLTRDLSAFVEEMQFEWVDPVRPSASLPPTDMCRLRAGASEQEAVYHERFAVRDVGWWERLRKGG